MNELLLNEQICADFASAPIYPARNSPVAPQIVVSVPLGLNEAFVFTGENDDASPSLL